MKEEWLMPGAVVPVDPDTTKALVDEIKRLIGVIGGVALQAAAPVQEPVAFFYPGQGFYWAKPTKIIAPVTVDVKPLPLYINPPAQPAPVQEPVAFNAGVPPLYPEMKDGETISVEYTTPPDVATPLAAQQDIQRLSALVRAQQITIDKLEAQRPWIGLTDEDKLMCWARATHDADVEHKTEHQCLMDYGTEIEAKLKEKNGLHRQHVIDGSPCWCEPETSYTDPETGASVVVHKEPQ